MMTCSDRVPGALASALAGRGYEILTPVQRAVLEVDPPTRDMLVSAPTGSGKTLAFGLALAGRVIGSDGRAVSSGAPRAIVITPTRELAQQVQSELARLYAQTGVRVVCCIGGTDMRAERAALAAGCEIVVGSPGRLRDHIERGALETARLASVVLDEADDMLDMGFRDDLEFLLRSVAPGSQTLMFSATVSGRIEELAARFQTGAIRIDAGAEGGVRADVRYEAVAVAPNDREKAIVNLLRYHDALSAIVFCATRETVAHLATRLDHRGFKVVALSGGLAQTERAAAMAAMREGRARVCVATDLAARGLDLPLLELVVHADLPASEAVLLHRSGRAGRAGKTGLAVIVAPHPQRKRAEALAQRAGVAIEWVRPPSPDEIRARDAVQLLDEIDRGPEATPDQCAAAAALLESRGPETVALAYIRLHLQSHPTPELLPEAAGDARPRIDQGVWFKLDRGRVDKADVRWILPLICRLGLITKKDVGRIVVRERETRFEIRFEVAGAFETAAMRANDAGVEISQAGGPEPQRRPPPSDYGRHAGPPLG